MNQFSYQPPARQSFSFNQPMQQPQGGFGMQSAGEFRGYTPYQQPAQQFNPYQQQFAQQPLQQQPLQQQMFMQRPQQFNPYQQQAAMQRPQPQQQSSPFGLQAEQLRQLNITPQQMQQMQQMRQMQQMQQIQQMQPQQNSMPAGYAELMSQSRTAIAAPEQEYRAAMQNSPVYKQLESLNASFQGRTPSAQEIQQAQSLSQQLENSPEVVQARNAAISAQRSFEPQIQQMQQSLQMQRQQMPQMQQRQQPQQQTRQQPMYGGIGGLGFNPNMGPQFGMPMGNFGYYR